ncbi:hypothetical protein BJY52DRAFT_1217099, partial [Lactarius psammicola]
SGITIPTSEPPLSSTFPPTAVDLQHNAHPLTPSDPPDLPSSASDLVLNNTLPIESYRPIIVTTAPSASPGLTSAPDPGAAAEDNCSPKPEPPLQSPSLPLVADSDVVVAGRSLLEPSAELSGDNPPHALHRRYDIV